MVSPSHFFATLYPFQDRILGAIGRLDTGFYLTGGTAASRGYLNHRFSDDLDLFVNDDDRFGLWAGRVIDVLISEPGCQVAVLAREERFVRLTVSSAAVELKIELVNDVPARVGEVRVHPVLGRLDTGENILANKLTAIADRQEPKDLADVWGFCCRAGLSIDAALTNAHAKAAGLFAPDLARVFLGAAPSDWELVRWIQAPERDQYLADLRRLGEALLLLEPAPR